MLHNATDESQSWVSACITLASWSTMLLGDVLPLISAAQGYVGTCQELIADGVKDSTIALTGVLELKGMMLGYFMIF